MKKLVIIPGGFHPFHGGHMALYNAAKEAFPSADVFVAATADTSTRPFPFELKKMLARAAGVPAERFIQVKSPFKAQEITQMYDPKDTQLIFVRSQKDMQSQPIPGGVKKDGTASYLQPYKRNGREGFDKHAYIAYLPTVQFGPGMTSATEIRGKWPELDEKQKIALVRALYPDTAKNLNAAAKVVAIFDQVLGKVEEVAQGAQTSLLGAPAGVGAGGLQPTSSSMPNGPDREPTAERNGITYEADERVVPQGGMGSYTPEALKSNLVMGLRDIAEYLKVGNYEGVYHLLYKDPVFKAKLAAMKDFDKPVSETDYRDEA